MSIPITPALMNKLTRPESVKVETDNFLVDELVNVIEKYFTKCDYNIHDEYVEMIIEGEWKKSVRNIVCGMYEYVGWKGVTHVSSSEHCEKPGLTTFKFYF